MLARQVLERELGAPGARERVRDDLRCKRTLRKIYFHAWRKVWLTHSRRLAYCTSYHILLPEP